MPARMPLPGAVASIAPAKRTARGSVKDCIDSLSSAAEDTALEALDVVGSDCGERCLIHLITFKVDDGRQDSLPLHRWDILRGLSQEALDGGIDGLLIAHPGGVINAGQFCKDRPRNVSR
jgi:hypothetical protein